MKTDIVLSIIVLSSLSPYPKPLGPDNHPVGEFIDFIQSIAGSEDPTQ